MNPGGGSGRDEPPLDIQIPDDARELDRDVLAYRREQRSRRRRTRLQKLTAPFGGAGTVMPLLASILAVCLVAGAMLSVATFGPTTAPATPSRPPASAASTVPSAPRSSPQSHATSSASAGGRPTASASGHRATASPSGARPSGSANSPAQSGSPSPARASHATPAGTP